MRPARRATRRATARRAPRCCDDCARVLAASTPRGRFDPGPILLVAVAAALYVRRWRAVARARPGTQPPARRALGARRAALARRVLRGRLLAVVAALISPVDALGEQVLTMHMVQHLLLLDVAPILAHPRPHEGDPAPGDAARPGARARAPARSRHPVFAVVLYVATMWLWHVPALYDAALEHPALHVLEHSASRVAGGLYWWHLLSPIRSRHRLSGMGPVVYMVATKLVVGLLGIVLTFAPDALYDFYETPGAVWGLTPTRTSRSPAR